MILMAGGLIGSYFAPVGCQANAQSDLPTVKMPLGSKTFTLEVAATNASRELGLMHRDSMPGDRGMIFIFPDEDHRSFWMKNTRIPLDIIYMDAGGAVVSVKPMKPYDLSAVRSDKPAKYAVELNKGMAEKAGVKAGDRIELPKEVKEAKVE